MDRDGALALADRALAHGVAGLVTRLLAPALVDLGTEWAQGEVGAAEASAAAGIVRSCIPHLSSPGLGMNDSRRTVAVCCPPGERHQIPAEMLTELLRNRGWQAHLLGPGVTPEYLPEFLAKQRPVALLVSVTTGWALPGTARVIEAAHRQGTPVMVGGGAFGSDPFLALRLGAAGWARSADNAVVLLETWSQGAPALPRSPELSYEYLGFGEQVPQILAAASDALARAVGDNDANQLNLLVRRLEAAVLVDDVRVFLEFLSWRGIYDCARGIASSRLEMEIDAVASVVAAESYRVHKFLDEGRHHLAWERANNDGAHPSMPFGFAHVVAPRPPVAAQDPSARVFLDLLSQAAKQCHAPMASISVPLPDGNWRTFRHLAHPDVVGIRDQLGENRLFSIIAERQGAMEISDLASHPDLAPTALARSRGGFRFAYGVSLRSPQDAALGVLCVVDHQPRTLTGRDRDAVKVIARQMTAELMARRDAQRPATQTMTPAPVPPDRAMNLDPRAGAPQLMRSHEVAALFNVTDRTISNWAGSGKLRAIRTGGGHLRFRGDDVYALFAGRAAENARVA